VAFVLVLVGALVYRSVDVSAKPRTAPIQKVVVAPAIPPAAAPGPPAPPTQGVSNQAVPKQGGLVAQVRGTGLRPAANTRTQKVPAAGSQAEPETAHVATQPAEPPRTDTAAVNKVEEVKANPLDEPPLATVPEVSADAASENRGKRMIKAVGRFLRIGGKKEVEPQPAPARPKPIQQ
jgi:hypothetical protein